MSTIVFIHFKTLFGLVNKCSLDFFIRATLHRKLIKLTEPAAQGELSRWIGSFQKTVQLEWNWEVLSDNRHATSADNMGTTAPVPYIEVRSLHFLWHSGERTLQWRHNGRAGVSNHQPHHCLFNRLFRRRSKKTSKLRVTGLCAGSSPVAGELPA